MAEAVHGLVPYAHVADLDRTIAFYSRLGFEVEDRLGGNWAALRSEAARLMISRATAPVDAGRQAVLFYLYVRDLPALRERLQADGVSVGEIDFPDQMPGGEARVDDPDGYCLLIGQLAELPWAPSER